MNDALSRVRERLSRFIEAEDADAVLDPSALEDAREAMDGALAVRGTAVAVQHVEPVHAVALLHLCRHNAGFPEPDPSDLQTSVSLFSLLYRIHPDLVPESLRDLVAREIRGDNDAARLHDSAARLNDQFELTADPELLDVALRLLQAAQSQFTSPGPERGAVLATLGNVLRNRFIAAGDPADIDAAVAAGRDAVTMIADAPPTIRVGALCALGTSLEVYAKHHTDRQRLDEAIDVLYQALSHAGGAPGAETVILANLANALRTRFTYARDVAALDEAVAADREAIALLAADDPRRFGLLSNLGVALLERNRHLGRDDDLREAVEVGRAAVDGTPDGPRKAVRLTHLSNALRTSYRTTGDSAELSEALDVARRAVELSGEDGTDRAICWTNLAAVLLISYGATGNPADMDEAVKAGRDAAAATPDGHTDLPNRLSNLALSLHVRYRALGRLSDLDEAAAVIQRAVDRAGVGHADRPMCLNSLAIIVSDRYARSSDPQDLDRAIAAGNAAVAAVPDGHPDRPGYLSNLAADLLQRSATTDSARDLDDSVSASRAAVATAPADNPDRPAAQLNLALALRQRYLRTRGGADLDEARALIRQAIEATAPGSPRMATFLLELGLTLLADQNDSVDPGRAAEAIGLWRRATATATAPIGTRLDAANSWARVAYLVGDHALAADGFAAAIGLLPVLAWHGLDQATRETHLSDWYGLSADAAACAIAAGRPELAVELLDRGRGVLWNQLLNVRTDLSYARRLAPEIVDRMTAIRAVLDAAPSRMDSQRDLLGPSGDGAAAEQRIVLAREWDTLIARLQALPGLESFLSVIPYEQLRTAARQGPVVIVNASAYRCDALIVTDAAEPQVVPLPELTIRDVTAQANALLGALLTLRRRDGLPARVGLRKQVDRTLSWLWETAAGPIVTALGLPPGPARGTARPRIWWSPTGPLTVLPLHAARPAPISGELNEPDGLGLLDRVTSSYTSTLAALIRARERGKPDAPRLAAVAVADTARLPGRTLAHVADELDVLRACCSPQTTLVDGDATVARVVEAMGSHEWLHFACHAGQNVAAPSTSALYLHDDMLSVSEIAALNLHRADLAFLSACQTAGGGVDVPDEAIHPAAALQVAGFRHVVATLWPIDDAKATGVVEAAYRALGGAGRRDSDRAATALHDAVLELRARRPGDYAAWAAYIHIGP